MHTESAEKQVTAYDPTEEDETAIADDLAQGYAGTTISEGCTSMRACCACSPILQVSVVKNSAYFYCLSRWTRDIAQRLRSGNTMPIYSCQVFAGQDDVQKIKAAANKWIGSLSSPYFYRDRWIRKCRRSRKTRRSSGSDCRRRGSA